MHSDDADEGVREYSNRKGVVYERPDSKNLFILNTRLELLAEEYLYDCEHCQENPQQHNQGSHHLTIHFYLLQD